MVDKPPSVPAGEKIPEAKSDHLASPARSDKSSDSEGRPVREKLKETRIDAQGSADQAPSSDQPMADATLNNQGGEASTSGSDNERGRLRRKRSREDFEDVAEDAKPLGKKHERHTRKKSRDITSPLGSDTELLKKKANGTIAPIAENDGDVNTPSIAASTSRRATPEGTASDKEGATVISPKNKRKLEQTAASNDATTGLSGAATATTKPEERNTKRPRDGDDVGSVSEVVENKPKIPSSSGFSNTSAASPFASVAPKSKPSTSEQPQTSDSAFKSSGFGTFASSTVSPFAAAAKTTTSSPFGAATGNKLSSFASKPPATTSTSSGFAGLGGATSSFASASSAKGSAFGGSLGGSAFGSAIGGKSGFSGGFGAGGSITGLSEKDATKFGAAEIKAASDSEGDDDGTDDQDGAASGNEPERRTGQPLLSATGPPETGEENEEAAWTGRAKLYTFINQDGKKSWQERGVGPLKLNVTREEPYKARFVLRADGTHRLLLNVAVTSQLRFGDASGDEPNDGRLLFAAPTATGEVESHMLRLKVERAAELWRQVDGIKTSKMYA